MFALYPIQSLLLEAGQRPALGFQAHAQLAADLP